MVLSALTTTVPCVGTLVPVTDNVLPSTSVSLLNTLIIVAVSSDVVFVSSLATGASLTAFTVTSIVAVVLPPLPSLTVTVKLSFPL